ncbi:MAG: hypothetical protein ACI9FN_000075 [Saprospiraceae bacterium]|jgi:hypothetical protein
MNDPVTQRFLKCYALLKERAVIRSARQFAISIDVFPQSLNEILKSRREVTIGILRKFCEKYEANPSYILSGIGNPILEGGSSLLSLSISNNTIPVVSAQQLQLYAAQHLEIDQLDTWLLPPQWCGKRITLAIQNNRMHLRPALQSGDILFCRSITQNSWKTCVIPNKIFVIVTANNVFAEKIQSLSDRGITGSTDEVGEQLFVSWDEIREIWMPQHKWSSAVESHQEITQSDIFQEIIAGQNRAIEQLQKTIHQLTSTSSHSSENINPISTIQLNSEGVLSPVST